MTISFTSCTTLMPISDPIKRAQKDREYHSRPEVKARNNEHARRRYHSGGREAKLAQAREYRSQPEIAERRTEYLRGRREERWAKTKLAELRVRARHRGLDFDIDETDLVLPKVCPVFGIPLILGVGKQSANSPSVDRVDNAKGYVKGNVVVISLRANSMKRAATIAELRALADFYDQLSQPAQQE